MEFDFQPANYSGLLGLDREVDPRVLRQQQQQIDQQGQQVRVQQQVAQQKLQQQQLYAQAVQAHLAHPTVDSAVALQMQFPEQAAAIKGAFEQRDKAGQDSDFRAASQIYGLVNAGRVDDAKTIVQGRIDAAKAAGMTQDADEDTQLLEMLNQDPKKALGFIGMHIAAINPENFAAAYGKLDPTEKTSPVMLEYENRVSKFGKAAADAWLAVQDTKLIPVQAGGSVYNAADMIGQGSPAAIPTTPQPMGGDQSTGAPMAGFAMPVSGGTFTSGFGTARDGGARRHNGLDIAAPAGSAVTPIAPGTVVKVGSDPRSGNFVQVRHADGTVSSYAHLARQSVKQGDAVGPQTSLGTVGTSGNATGPVVHLVIRKNGKAVDPRPLLGAGPVTVRSIQEANRLPKGTHYRNPQGREFVR